MHSMRSSISVWPILLTVCIFPSSPFCGCFHLFVAIRVFRTECFVECRIPMYGNDDYWLSLFSFVPIYWYMTIFTQHYRREDEPLEENPSQVAVFSWTCCWFGTWLNQANWQYCRLNLRLTNAFFSLVATLLSRYSISFCLSPSSFVVGDYIRAAQSKFGVHPPHEEL